MIWLTLALVVITGYYAWQTRRTVVEMRKSREAEIQPRLVPVVQYDEAGLGSIAVENIGAGPALHIELTLNFEPNGTNSRIRLYLLKPGGRRLWNPARTGQQESLPQHYQPDAHLPNHESIHLTGSCRDLLRREHRVDERTPASNRWELQVMGRWITGEPPQPGA